MKDFYKILGVKEDASEEEIRERWIELTKQYHPDRGEESTSDEKIREINEAYQVLKHSSTRVEYDLKRTFNHRNRRRKGTVHFKRWSVPASILIILIVIGLIYIRNHQFPPSSKPIVSNKVDSIKQTNQTDQRKKINQIDQTDQKNKTNQTDERDQKDQTSQTAQKNERNQRDQINERNQINQKTSSIPVAATMKKVRLVQPPKNPITPLPVDLVANKPTPSINQIDQTDQKNKTNQTDERDQKDQINQRDQINKRNQINSSIEIAQFKPPSLLATEDEVKKFFDDYVNYHNRKDAKGILSLFSSQAIQNQRDGPGEIRKIYAVFFGESQEIRYSLQDMKIEIYQNAVDVKARYEIEQIVKETGEKEVWRGPIRWVLNKEDGKLKILSMDYKYQRPL